VIGAPSRAERLRVFSPSSVTAGAPRSSGARGACSGCRRSRRVSCRWSSAGGGPGGAPPRRPPSPRAWQGARMARRVALTARARDGLVRTVAHPLLRSWARPSMEAATLLRGSGGRLVEHVHPTLGGARADRAVAARSRRSHRVFCTRAGRADHGTGGASAGRSCAMRRRRPRGASTRACSSTHATA
jgi:hypothetical protein